MSCDMSNVPTSTKLTIEASSIEGEASIQSVFMIFSSATGQKGTGFLLETGHIITNYHVVKGAAPNQLIAVSSFDERVGISEVVVDELRDLACLKPAKPLDGGFSLPETEMTKVGTRVETWGFPLGYSGPNPLLSIGHIAGYRHNNVGALGFKHIVVNGAFNQGNSGGPLIRADDQKLIGVVVAKHAPLTFFQRSALEVMAGQKSGFTYHATDDKGNQHTFTEAQLVADLLHGLLQLTQVMIGEAVAGEELITFLDEKILA